MMISGHQLCTWLPLIAVALPVIGAIVRYSVLLAGLIVTLPRSVEADRPDIFREFARAVAISRHNNSVAARVEVDNEVAPAPRPSSENGSLHDVVVARLDAVHAQNRSQLSQFEVQPIQFLGHRQAAGRGLAHLAALLVQVLQVRPHAYPPTAHRPTRPETAPAATFPGIRAATGSPAVALCSGQRPGSPAPAAPRRRPREEGRAEYVRCRCRCGQEHGIPAAPATGFLWRPGKRRIAA
jgi:hypothetical protein